ncbi:MAG: hypothetical protein PHN44_04335, partial [Candidatus Marinimicrobia bacterium]|nr:hypothetical protein [Candidatus Neomarinimicrobiota bacterium]
MTTRNVANPLSRKKLEDTLTIWDGVTTSDGAAGKTSLIDSNLIGYNDFITDQVVVLILDGSAAFEKKVAVTFNNATGEITFAAMSAQIVAGTSYRLVNFASPEDVGTILADIVALMADVGDASAST